MMPATPAWPPRSAPRLFVHQQLAPDTHLTFDGTQAHYLSRVMRTAVGDTVILCDNQTGEWAATVTVAGKREIALEIVQHLRPREPVPDFWLCPALLKKDRFDFVLEKATELGVAAIRPVIAHRCVADKLNAGRARTIVTEAAEQCSRTALPELAEPVKLDRLLADWPEKRVLFFADETGGEPAAEAFAALYESPRRRGLSSEERYAEGGPRLRGDSAVTPAAILIGPEGGFDDGERAAIRAHPAAVAISLGPRILRGETAALAAVALWMGIAGDWGSQGDCLSGAAS